jgi:hypothetical protein
MMSRLLESEVMSSTSIGSSMMSRSSEAPEYSVSVSR